MMKRKLCLSIVALVLPFTAALGAAAHFTLGIPGAPEIRVPSSGAPAASQNPWLSSNNAYAAMCTVMTPGSTNAVSDSVIASLPRVKLDAMEAGFVLERILPGRAY